MAINRLLFIFIIMDKRGKAYRIWKGKLKYISRLNRNLYYWYVKDESAPTGWRLAKNWKELDTPDSKAKQYKNISKKWTSIWDKLDAHLTIKKIRKETKDLTNNIFKNNEL